MDSMTDQKGKEKEKFHKQISSNIEANKIKYDRQLYSDWIVKVYDRC